jgi:hypothetical protein
MYAATRLTMMKRVAMLRRFSSTNLLGLLGALLRIAVPGVDIVDQVRMHLMMWPWSTDAVTRSLPTVSRWLRSLRSKVRLKAEISTPKSLPRTILVMNACNRGYSAGTAP